MTGRWSTQSCGALVIVLSAAVGMTLDARQREDTAELGDRLRARYDIVALQNGIGLVPRQRDDAVRIIEIREGAVAVNGQVVTGRELRTRLGSDAELVPRVTYLGAEDQRRLAQSQATGAAAGDPAPDTRRPEAPPSPVRQVRRDGDVVRIFGNVSVPTDELVDGDVVVVGGNAYIDGEVTGELTVVMGNV